MGTRRAAVIHVQRPRQPMTARQRQAHPIGPRKLPRPNGSRAPSQRRRRPSSSEGGRWLWLLPTALVAGLLAWAWPLIAELLSESGRRLWEGLGLGLFLTALWLAGLTWALRRQRFGYPFPWRLAIAATLFAIFILGALSLVEPSWAPMGIGGQLGGALTTGLALGPWASTALAAFALLWPRGLLRALLAGPTLALWTWRHRLPHRAWTATLRLMEALLPREEAPLGHGNHAPPAPEEVDLLEEALPLEETAEAHEEQTPARAALALAAESQEPAAAAATAATWQMPSIDLLHTANGNGNGNGHGHGKAQVDNLARARLIEEALASFGVDAKVVQINQGPTVTQFGIEPGWEVKTKPILERDNLGRPALDREGKPRYHREEVSRTRVRVNRITTLANDLALSLAAPSIRIEAPVPGKPVIGIEVPNPVPSLVTLRSVIESTPFQKLSARSKLALALGIGVSGEPVVADLAKMPHLLIAGATGSGKSVCLNSVIACLLMHATPADVRFILVDPKRVELSLFATIPHLAFPEIVIDVEKVVGALQAVVGEMEARYRRFAAAGARNIEGYNRHHAVREKLPYWVVVIDELADLMMAAPYEVERLICRLAQLARATGIHLVVATQRPSVDVVTGLIKANFPTRIAFAVTSQVDSRTILDGGGAEKLLGRGDMLYMPTDAAKPKRLQGTYVSDQELQRLVGFWNEARFQSIRPTPHALPEVQEKDETPEEDPLLVQARELAQQHSRISASLLQRRLRVGYPRAARLLDMLEEEGIVEAAEGGGSRLVLGREGTSE